MYHGTRNKQYDAGITKEPIRALGNKNPKLNRVPWLTMSSIHSVFSSMCNRTVRC